MRWDNAIALVLTIAFLMFITMRGELPTYMSFVLGTATPAPTPSAKAQPQKTSADVTNEMLRQGAARGNGGLDIGSLTKTVAAFAVLL
jgi:hypothetical protein